jgi:hypothetical protein
MVFEQGRFAKALVDLFFQKMKIDGIPVGKASHGNSFLWVLIGWLQLSCNVKLHYLLSLVYQQ